MHYITSFSFNNAGVLYVFARKTFNLIDFDAVFFSKNWRKYSGQVAKKQQETENHFVKNSAKQNRDFTLAHP